MSEVLKKEKSEDTKKRRGRPRLAAEDAKTRKLLIRTGLEFLTEKGYSAVGIQEILKNAGVPKGCFYHYFKSKEDFGLQLIAEYQMYFSKKLDQCYLDDSLTPLQRLRAFTQGAKKGMQRHAFKRGCLVGNLGQEMGALPEPFRELLITVLEDWQKKTETCLRLAQTEGEISADLDPEAHAKYFWIGWEGAVLRSKLERSAQPLDDFTDIYFSSLI